jgi:hypothetical protein
MPFPINLFFIVHKVLRIACSAQTIGIIWLLFSFGALAQNLSNLRTRTIALSTDTLRIDTLSIVPATLKVTLLRTQTRLDTSNYSIQYEKALLIWKTTPRPDSVTLQYRVFPYLFSQTASHKNPKQIKTIGDDITNYYQYQIKKQQELENRLFGSNNGLEYSGSFGRSIAVGNSQDLTANSNFNLQIAGKLTNDISILGAITDNNIPFQPEGNTQQIQDFDRIYVQLTYKNSSLLLGDYDLRAPSNQYFTRFARRLQGAQINHTQKIGKDVLTTSVSGATARGNYYRQTLTTVEGNQGPYKLIGSRGETFIIVLSGSEKVYIDGKLLTRGFDNDYIIDYNTAELSFMPRQLITKDKRVVIEFQYSDRSYLRSTFAFATEYKSAKWTIKSAAISEQDSKNQAVINNNLTELQRKKLETVGDSITQAVVQSIDTTEFKTDSRIYYKALDTLVNGILYPNVLQYSINPDSARYIANFSFVGNGRGFYELSTDNINGRIYRWTAPDSLGNLQGSYEPLVQLAAPRRNQLFSVSGTFNPTEKTKLWADVALSNNDLNTFSAINNSDNAGIATAFGAEHTISLAHKNTLSIGTQYEFAQRNFQTTEPYRNLEFARDWNTQAASSLNNSNQTSPKTNEHLGQISLKLKTKTVDVGYQLATFIKPKQLYTGFKQNLVANYHTKYWNATAQISYLTSASDSMSRRSAFFRPNATITRTIKLKKTNWNIGVKSELEQNRLQTPNSNELATTAFYYHQSEFFIENGADTTTNRTAFRYQRRYDYTPKGNRFAVAAIADNINLEGAINKNPKNQWQFNATYRHLNIQDTTAIIPNLGNNKVSTNTNTFLAGITQNLAAFKGLLRASTQYQIGTGQRQITEIYYQKVDAGRGNYIWQDANNNQTEETGEFLLASQNDLLLANYIQIVLPTPNYQSTNIVQFNESLNLSPRAYFANAKGVLKAVNLLSWQTVWQLRRETFAAQSRFIDFAPFGVPIPDSIIVSQNNNLRNTLFINRNNAKYELSFYQFNSITKNFLVNGTDLRRRNEWGTKLKIALSTKFTLDVATIWGNNAAQSVAFVQQNYAIRQFSTEPSLSFTPNKNWRASASFKYKYSVDTLETTKHPAIVSQLNTDLRYGSASKRAISARFSYAIVSYTGANNSPAAYTLLEGLQTGNNFLWNITFDTQLSNNTQLNIMYDGRKTGDNRINHIGRVGVRAVF